MPYIKEEDKKKLGYYDNQNPSTAGELNYLITRLMLRYLTFKKPSYQTYNDLIGVLECAKMELYRRKIADYENEKIQENGDVYK